MDYNEEAILCNLRDAGCAEATIQKFMALFHAGKMADGLKCLAAHRRFLLEDLHASQKRIDCLDYLVYVIKKQTL